MVLLQLVVVLLLGTPTLADFSLFGVGKSAGASLKYEGCFSVNYDENRGLNHTLLPFTLDSCVRLCMVKDTRYAGVEARRNRCYCVNEEHGESDSHSACDVKCRGRGSYTCGGTYRMSLYEIKDSNVPGFVLASKRSLQYFRNNTLARGYIKMALDFPHVSVSYDYRMSEIYVSSGNKIERMSYSPFLRQFLKPTTVVELVVGTVRVDIIRIAFDWVSRTLYCGYEVLGMGGLFGIASVNLDTNHVEDMAQGTFRLRDLAVDPFARKIVYICGEYLGYVDLVTGGTTNNSVAEFGFPYVSKIAVDFHSQRAYMVAPSGRNRWYLLSSRYDLTDLRVLTRRPQLATAFSLRFFQSQLFWGENTVRERSALYSSSVSSSGTLLNVTELAKLPTGVKTMTLYHMDEQTSAKDFLCNKKGCSHDCSYNGFWAECWCPNSHTLSVDGRTCEETVQSLGEPIWQEPNSREDLEGSGIDYEE